MSTRARFLGVHLAVADMAAAVAFYRLVGLDVPAGAEESEHVEVDLGGGVHLALSLERVVRMYDPGWRPPQRPPSSALQLQVDTPAEVDDLYADLTAADHHGHLPPKDAFWGGRYAEVDDPDGNIVGIHGPRQRRG